MAQPPDTRTPESRDGDRIAKLLARAGVASRREIERMIAEGRVAIDGTPIDTPATVLKTLRGVTVDGQPVAAPEATRLFLYHKPTGLLVTERDPKGRTTIYDRLPRDLPRVVPVGRLDLNTEGLLLLTTDGGFKRQLELPATGVERSYRARAYGNVTQAQLEDLADGVEIEGIRYGSIDANIERRTGANVWIEITITEGKNREVRRVLEYLGLQVSRLIRTRYGPFVLGDLPIGEVGEVKQHEVVAFRRTLKGGAPDEPIGVAAPRAGFRSAPTTDRTTRTRAADPARPAAARPAAVARPARRDDAAPVARAGFRTAATADRSERSRGRASGQTAREVTERPARRDDAAPVARAGFRTAATADRSERTRGRSGAQAPRDTAERPAGARRADTGARTTRRDDAPAPGAGGRSNRAGRPDRGETFKTGAPAKGGRSGVRSDRGKRDAPRSGPRTGSGRPARPDARPPRRDGPSSGGNGGTRPTAPGGRPPRGRRP